MALSTSGAGDFKIQGIDAISSVSRLTDVPARVVDVSRPRSRADEASSGRRRSERIGHSLHAIDLEKWRRASAMAPVSRMIHDFVSEDAWARCADASHIRRKS